MAGCQIVKELQEFFEEMSKVEKEYAEKLRGVAPRTQNLVIRTILEAVAQDSYKHSLIYSALARIAEGGKEPLLTEDEAYKIGKEIEDHIRTEAEMIRRVEKILEKEVGDNASEFLLKSILQDEFLHHAVLKKVKETIVARETMRETDWDIVWKDAYEHRIPYIYTPAHRRPF